MLVRKQAKDTLTAVELNIGETLEFKLTDGRIWRMTLKDTGAEVYETTLEKLGVEVPGAVSNYRFYCELEIDGENQRLEREVATQNSFYEPWTIEGVNIWFDAVGDIFDFLTETHGECRPKKDARFALQEATLDICPETLAPWCPLPEGGLQIESCYNGEDCWLGAYFGAAAHGGLDINHPAGTPIYAPLDIHDHYYFNSVEMGHNNNRWRGVHRFENGSEWIFQVHHMLRINVEEYRPIQKGEKMADGAGVWVGDHNHSHFVFKVYDGGEIVMLDPWILFWKMYRDQRRGVGGHDEHR